MSEKQQSSLIQFRNVQKVYGEGEARAYALKGIDLEINKGEFVAIMGPSGSGKSTMMNIIGCLDTPSNGNYLFEGVEVGTLGRDQLALLRRHYLGFIFQGFNLLAKTSALENVELPLIYKGIAPQERRKMALEALEQVGISHVWDHTPAELSGGQQQRVAIARAIVTNPKILLADEPTGNLDTARSIEIMELLQKFNKEQGITVIMVTHEKDMAHFAQRIIHFKDGLIENIELNAKEKMFINALLLALKEIKRNLLRSFLTVLGIVIGVASVIAMVILGDGTTAHITENISKLGSNMLTLSPGAERRGPASAGITTKPFNIDDITVLKRETTSISAVAPSTAASLTAVYGNANHTTAVYGTNNDYFTIRDWTLDQGRTFTEQELSSGKAVCVIGHTIQEELFGQQNPLNKTIRLEKFSCLVIGTLESKGAAGMRGMDQDDFIAVPIRMFQRRISGSRDISAILLSFKKDANIEQAKKEVTLIMREIRRIRKGMDDDFHVRDMQDIIKTMRSTTKMLTYLLGSVAAISLLVGGIGIMNIMLVSVTERTREIGIRLAIGAMEREVLLQFLVESIVLSSLGGLIGIIIGLAIAFGATNYFDIPFVINTTVIVVAFIFSMFVGIFFGYFLQKKRQK